MQPEPKPHVSHWIAWSFIALAVGLLGFFSWRYYDEITTIYDNAMISNFGTNKKTATPSTDTTATATSTADWKTYTSPDYGFSFKYPKDWTEPKKTTCTLQNCVGGVTTIGTSGTSDGFSVGISETTYYTTISKWVDDKQTPPVQGQTVKDVLVAGISAKKILTPVTKGTNVDTGFIKTDKLYEISVLAETNLPVYDAILSTFTFTK